MEQIESEMTDWDIQQARETYNTAYWSGGYFDVGPRGTLLAYPDRDRSKPGIDLARLADEAREAGLAVPVLGRCVAIRHDRGNSPCNSFCMAVRADTLQGQHPAG